MATSTHEFADSWPSVSSTETQPVLIAYSGMVDYQAFVAALIWHTSMPHSFNKVILGLICLSGLLIIGISLFIRAYIHLWPD